MDSSFREEGSETQLNTKSSFKMLRASLSIIKWLATLIHLTEAEQEEAGIHIGRAGDE